VTARATINETASLRFAKYGALSGSPDHCEFARNKIEASAGYE